MFIKDCNTLIEKTIGKCWLETVRLILKSGNNYHDEGRPLKELTGVRLIITHPSPEDSIIDICGNKKTVSEFKKAFFGNQKWLKDVDISPNFGANDAISYSVRLFDYEGFNQIQNVIDRLAKIPESKRCLVSTPMPNKDWGRDYLPCIDTIHFLLRENKLNVFVHCRGLDFAQKAYANFTCLAKLQSYVAEEISKKTKNKLEVGNLDLLIDSAHIYKNTMPIVEKMLAKVK